MTETTWMLLVAAAALIAAVWLWFRSDEERAEETAPSTTRTQRSVTGERGAKARVEVAEAPAPAPSAPPEPKKQRPASPLAVPKLQDDDDDDDELQLTRVTVAPRLDDDDDEETVVDDAEPSVVPILYDEEAGVDEPTQASAFILVSAVGQTDRGKRRKINEDSLAVLEEQHLYVVADGMGGHAGGEVASSLAVSTLIDTFKARRFDAHAYPAVPKRGGELVQAVQRANRAVYDKAQADPTLREMGTTIVSARFSPQKPSLYVGHVGDSRCYQLRGTRLIQMTTDHTMAQQGVEGPFAPNLTRAVGIERKVSVDLVMAKPKAGDQYLLCSDGLSKMLSDDEIRDLLVAHEADPNAAVKHLIDAANEKGGRDNVTVILVQVQPTAAAAARLRR